MTERSTELEQLAGRLFDAYAGAYNEQTITRPITSRAVIAAAFLGWNRGDNMGAVIFDEEMHKRGVPSELAIQTVKVRNTIARRALADTGLITRKADSLEEALQLLVENPSAS